MTRLPAPVLHRLAALAAVLGVAGCAAAAGEVRTGPLRPRYGVSIQATYDRRGNPDLVANFAPDGGLAKPTWSICRPPDTSVCTPVHPRSQFLTPGLVPPGTVFRASVAYRGRTYLARTAAWLGQIHATALPSLRGAARAGHRVRPLPARWSGGWAAQPGGRQASFDALSVEACRTRAGRHCVNLTPEGEGGLGTFSHRPSFVPHRFVGFYLFAFDERYAADTAFVLPLVRTEAINPLRVGPTVARSAPVGPIR